MSEVTQLHNDSVVIADWRDDLTTQVRQEMKTGMDYKKGRIKRWHDIEDAKYGNTKKTLGSQFNVPFPFMSGFLDTWKAKTDDPFTLKITDSREAGYRVSLKLQAFYEQESTDEDNDWETIDLFNKDAGFTYAKAITKSYPEVGETGYKFCVEDVDPYDFYDNPLRGAILEKHEFCGQDNIFVSRYDLVNGGDSGYYDKKQVFKLLTHTGENQLQKNQESYQAKQNRLIAHGLDNKTFTYAGQSMYKLVESGTTFKGKRYLVTWNEETGLWLRVKELKEVFESGLWPWSTWFPKPEAHNSWPQGPADDFLPVAIAMNLFLNQELDNRNKINWNMRAYDPDMFPEPSEFEWAPDGLVQVKSGATKTRRIEEGIYSFTTPQMSGTINMVDYLDNMSGTKLGINAAAQGGAGGDEKVGIFFGNQQNISDRVELSARQYRKNHIAIARRFIWGAYQYLQEPVAIELVGEKGLEWDKLRKNEINPLAKIRIEGGSAQMQQDEIKAKKRSEAQERLLSNPQVAAQVNSKWLAEDILRTGEVPPDQLAAAMDTKNYGNRELLAEAAEAIEDLIKGKYPKLNYGANTAFIKKLMDFAYDNELKPNIFDRIIAYAQAHIPIAADNAARMARMEAAASGGQVMIPKTEEEQATLNAMMPAEMGGGRSNQLTAEASPAMPVSPQ